MKDVRRDLADLARSLERIPARNGGRQVMVIGADLEDDASSVAASLSLLMSGRASKSAWLIELDLVGNQQFHAFQNNLFRKTGRPGRAYDASLNVKPFFQIVPELRTRNGEKRVRPKYLAAHQIESSKLMVTRFRNELLHQGQRVQINSQADFWHRLRGVADWAVIDAPPLDFSRAGLAVCRHMDGVICVVTADNTKVDQITALRSEIETHGGHCLGVVVNGVKGDARFADRIAL
jgi:Mrp family chromosome partitioning ATPase